MTSSYLSLILLITLTIHLITLDGIVCPAIPGAESSTASSNEHKDKVDQELDDLGLEYGRYLQQVVSVLEQDKEFASKLENASVDMIKSGAIADQLHFVDHSVRSKLDELKRVEMERLHKLTMKEKLLKDKIERENGNGSGGKFDGVHHIDHSNPHSFEVEDLHRLILAATKDLEVIDEKRKEEFKEYEMKKELEYRAQLANSSNDTERQEIIKKHEERLKKHRDHPRVHHPGSKAQLEQVWEEQDHLPKNEFDPKTFFSLHDINGDGYLDQQEVEALLSLEIKKVYDPAHNPDAEDDPREMMEEYHRMREHIYKEADKDKDGLISRKEFLDLTSRPDFETSDREGWQEIDPAKNPPYSEHDINQYYQQLHAQQMRHPQMDPSHYYYYQHAPPPVQYYQHHPGQGAPYAPGGHPPQYQQQHHPGQQQYQGQQQQIQFQPLPPGQQHYGIPQQHPNQQQQYGYQQIPQEQLVQLNGETYHLPAGQQQQQQQQYQQQPPQQQQFNQPQVGGQQRQPPNEPIGQFPPQAQQQPPQQPGQPPQQQPPQQRH